MGTSAPFIGIDGVGAGEDAVTLLFSRLALDLALVSRALNVGRDGVALCSAVVMSLDQRVFRRQDAERHAEDRIRAAS